MNYLSVCSGIEAATVAWHDMGWNPVGFSEIDKFPSQVLSHHYPHITNYGDMAKFMEWNINEPVNLLVGGTPCQSFSIAGLRQGLEDPRGNLMLTYLAILNEFRPKWCIWENVPGVLSSNGGRDFGTLLGAMVELGYGFAYRVLDAQNFGVAQRRRRVFVVGCIGDDWRSAAKVLFESESLCWDPEKVRVKREKNATVTTNRLVAFGEYSDDGTASTIKARDYKDATDLIVYENDLITSTFKIRNGCSGGGKGYLGQNEKAFTISTIQDQNLYHQKLVRRLTPMECERLQGFPDNYTNIPTSSDTKRYKALGNSMAVPVMKWIGQRINNV